MSESSQDRREFLKLMASGAVLAGLGSLPFRARASSSASGKVKLVILHTNDQHSHIEPFPANDPKYPGMGGFARRAAVINDIRKAENNVVLLDAGDIFQGSPYFNFFGGEPELKLMSEMGYDAATLGNHDFDNGLDGLAKVLPHAKFPFVSANYDFTDTPVSGKIQKYTIIHREGVRIGIFGLGVKLEGLVPKKAYGNTRYSDPFEKAAQTALLLKKEKKCDVIICLSHLGIDSDDNGPCDMTWAKQSKHIDVLIGGHSHRFIDPAYQWKNSDGEDIVIAQVGWGGIKLGRIDLIFDKKSGKKEVSTSMVKIFKNQV